MSCGQYKIKCPSYYEIEQQKNLTEALCLYPFIVFYYGHTNYDRSLIMKEPNNETKNLKFPIKFLYIEYLIQITYIPNKEGAKKKTLNGHSLENLT